MKTFPLLVILLLLAACSTSQVNHHFRPDVLYFHNTEAGRESVQHVTQLFGGKQEAAVVDGEIPPTTYPVAKFMARPVYPKELLMAGLGGTVTVYFVIGETGDVIYAAPITSSDSRLNDAAVAAVLKWKFKPAQREGVNVRSQLQVPIEFTQVP